MPTPLMIAMALHYRMNTVEDFRGVADPTLSAVADAIDTFKAAGLLKENVEFKPGRPRFVATEGMVVWINAMCRIPFPERRWLMPEAA